MTQFNKEGMSGFDAEGRRTDIRVTISSHSMQALHNSIRKLSARGNYVSLIVQPDDTLELYSLVSSVADRRGDSPPCEVRPDNEEGFWRYGIGRIPEEHSLLVYSGSRIPKSSIAQLHHPKRQRRILVVCFTSEADYEWTVSEWTSSFRAMFPEKPLTWPPLTERKRDIEGILASICTTLKTPQQVQSQLDDPAETLITQRIKQRRYQSVAEIRSHLARAFKYTLRKGNNGVITDAALRATAQGRGPSNRPMAQNQTA